jgi:hypothetical protein
MITKQMIQEKLKKLTEEQLNQVYGIIEQLTDAVEKPSLMSKLRKIKIDAPEDFSIQVGVVKPTLPRISLGFVPQPNLRYNDFSRINRAVLGRGLILSVINLRTDNFDFFFRTSANGS